MPMAFPGTFRRAGVVQTMQPFRAVPQGGFLLVALSAIAGLGTYAITSTAVPPKSKISKRGTKREQLQGMAGERSDLIAVVGAQLAAADPDQMAVAGAGEATLAGVFVQ